MTESNELKSRWETIRQASHWWVVVPAFLGALSYAMISAPYQQLIIDLVCEEYLSRSGNSSSLNSHEPFSQDYYYGQQQISEMDDKCKLTEVESRSSLWIMILTLCLTIPPLFMVGFYGSLSDKYGRVRIMTIPLIGLLLNRVLIFLTIWFDLEGPWWLIPGQIIQGFTGGMPTLFMTCFTYTADVSDASKRSTNFGIIEGFLFLGFVIGPFIGGALSEKDSFWPFVLTAILNAVTLAFAFVAPESIKRENRVEVLSFKRANIFGTLGILFYSKGVFLLALGFAMVILCYNGFILVFVLYSSSKFGWGEYDHGTFLSVQWAARSVGVGFILPLALKFVNENKDTWERNLLRLGTFSYIGAFLLYALAPLVWVFYLGTSLDGIGAMVLPLFRSTLSQSVPSHEQGRILSATGVLEGLIEILAPLIFNFTYVLTVDILSSTSYLIMSGTLAISFIATILLPPPSTDEELKPLIADREKNYSVN